MTMGMSDGEIEARRSIDWINEQLRKRNQRICHLEQRNEQLERERDEAEKSCMTRLDEMRVHVEGRDARIAMLLKELDKTTTERNRWMDRAKTSAEAEVRREPQGPETARLDGRIDAVVKDVAERHSELFVRLAAIKSQEIRSPQHPALTNEQAEAVNRVTRAADRLCAVWKTPDLDPHGTSGEELEEAVAAWREAGGRPTVTGL